jgi:amino acid adenylation domain-containing protein
MKMVEFIEELEVQGVELLVHGDRLRYRGEKDVITPQVLSILKEHKAEIIALQQDRTRRATLCAVSHGQSALWFLHQVAPDSAAYNVGFAANVRARIDIPALQHALEKIVARHASLRTTFPTRNGGPTQEIHRDLPPAFELIEARELNLSEIVARVAEAYKRPFNLETGPLLRTQLFRRNEEDCVLLFTVHHLVCDAWSLWLFLEELGAIYLAEHTGRAEPLTPLAASYADYVRWQRQLLRGAEGEGLWDYWKRKLEGLPVLNLPTDRPRPPVQSYTGASTRFQLGPELTAQLKAFTATEGTTLYMVILAAFEVLLHRYSGQEEIVIGSPTSGRTQRQFAGIVGDFINTIVLRSPCDSSSTFRAFLARVSETTLEAIAHQDFPFSLLVERLHQGRDSDRAPLFQVLFNYLKPQNFRDAIELWVAHDTGNTFQWGGLPLGPFPLLQQEGQTDLTLEMCEGKTALFGILKYNVDLFDEATIVRMAGHFETLLRGVLANPNSSLAELPLLTDSERHRLLVEWNDTRRDFPRDKCVHQLFEDQVRRSPQAIAVVCEGHSLSYSQLNSEANKLADRLKSLGVGPGALVGLCVERSLAMLIGMIGILKAGAAYLPLDPDHPQARLDFILQDAGIDLLVTHKMARSNLRFDGQPGEAKSISNLMSNGAVELAILRVPGSAARETPKRSIRPRALVTPEDLAYVIYTSGSTGQPKGVQLCHRNVVNFLCSMAEQPGFSGRDTIVAVTTLSFDIAVLELLLPITVGGQVVIAKREVAVDPERLSALIEESRATVLQATPATWRLLLDSGWRGNPGLKILVGGEAWSPELGGELSRRCGSLWNMYGPTETAVWSAISKVDSAERISIGRPIANTEVFVLQPRNQLAPIGIPGELYIGGEGLARGYWNRPVLNEKAFVPHPFSKEQGAKLYKTGDMVRYRADGTLDFLGRVDFQIKIRGYRVELGEIETILRQLPGVRDAIVVAREDVPGDKRLVAYTITSDSEPVAMNTMRDRLIEKLPDYMVPSAFVAVETFPLTASGKIDRKALPKPNLERGLSAISFSNPETPTQKSLAAIWSELLGLEKVGLDDNLFQLGGHSLMSVRLVTMIRQRFSIKVPVMSVFTHPTLRGLSTIIDSQITGNGHSSPISVTPAMTAGPVAVKAVDTEKSFVRSLKAALGFEKESFFQGPLNRVLQMVARTGPGALRVKAHRWRGVRMGTNILIGYDTIIETSYPWLVSIGSNSAIGMRVTMIGHFLGMERSSLKDRKVSIDIGENVWIGPGSLILPNVSIGDGSVVAAGSVVAGSVPPGVMVQGNPAKPVARCPVPIKPDMPFEEFVKHLEPLDGEYNMDARKRNE